MNVFVGDSSLQDYLNPENHPMTPLVEIPSAFRQKKIRIFAKQQQLNPLTNVKAIPAARIVRNARDNGDKSSTLVEFSSGNMATSLAVIGRLYGYSRTVACVSHLCCQGVLNQLRFFGAVPLVNKEPREAMKGDKTTGQELVKVLAKKNNWYNTNQYGNSANPESHTKITGAQLKAQLPSMTHLCLSMGSGGTLVGAGALLRDGDKDLVLIGVRREVGHPIPGPRDKYQLQHFDFDFESMLNSVQDVEMKSAYQCSLDLCRMGIVCGPSSGMAYAGLLQYLDETPEDQLVRNSDGETIVAFICCDLPHVYMEEYFKVLGPEFFPEIENAHLLASQESSG